MDDSTDLARFGLPGVMTRHIRDVLKMLDNREVLSHAAIARLTNPTLVDLAKGLHDPRGLVGQGARALNEAPGGILALTNRRLIYLGRTLVARSRLKGGNERWEVPLGGIRSARYKRGIGIGDIRSLASQTLTGSKLWATLAERELAVIEIKPLDAAANIAAAINGKGGE